MIVISQSLVLSAPDPLSLDAPIIGYENLVQYSSITADTAAAGYPATNLANESTGERWQAADTSEQYVSFGLGSAEIDYVGIARHNLGSAQIPVSIEGLAGPEDDWAEIAADIIAADDRPLLFRFTRTPLSDVRIRLQAGSAAARMAVVYVGRLLVMPRGVRPGFTPLPYGRSVRVTNNQSESGAFLGAIVTGASRRSTAAFQHLDPDWYRASFDPFLQAAIGGVSDLDAPPRPFFFAWRPQSYPREVGYAWLTEAAVPTINDAPELVDISLSMNGIA